MRAPAWLSGLRFQFLLLLTLALLPLGAVAIYQTNRVATEAGRNAELALLSLTARAAKAEELIIERAFGAARFFGTIAEDFQENPDRCTRDLSQFVERNDRYSFIGILPLSGIMTCTSSGGVFDFSQWPGFEQNMADQKRTIVVNTEAPASQQSVFVISEPFDIDGEFAGFISISIPHKGLPATSGTLTDLGLEELITFNPEGRVLTARSGLDGVNGELPAARSLDTLRTSVSMAFRADNNDGQSRTYTVVPIEGSPATVLGVWRDGDGLANTAVAVVRPALFPILMWFASMGVAMLSIHMLVVRHLNRLRSKMDEFAETRRAPARDTTTLMPTELQALSDNFDRMAYDILQDEAQLENAVHEKNVLIKEVHHRVKNNLQLISSIMNMQIRAADEEETRTALMRVQDRVRSLATIHRDLYQSQNAGRVDAGGLISEIIEGSREFVIARDLDVDLKTDIDQVMLYPDQSVPLSLLAAEGATNMMKYIGAPEGKKPWIFAGLSQEDGRCILTLANSVGGATPAESTGLGSDLMEAFAIQLGGDIVIDRSDDSYSMRIEFAAQEFEPAAQDY
ncbi:MAG: sensor histidine kinase [Pseudomonadota bacterium]